MPVLLLCLPLGCQRSAPEKVHDFFGLTMGTSYSVSLISSEPLDGSALSLEIQSRLDHLNHLMSTWEPESDLSRFNRHLSQDPFELSDETAEVARIGLEICDITGGALDPTVAPLVELWGFGTAQFGEFPARDRVEALLGEVGYRKLSLAGRFLTKQAPNLSINFNAIAKGFAVDSIARLMTAKGFTRFLVEIGGEVRCSGLNEDQLPWRIAIEDPAGSNQRSVYKVVGLNDMSMATSGDYRNFFFHDQKRYTHIIDPRTGFPVEAHVASATVIASDCVRADGLATAFMVLSPEESLAIAESLPNVECLLLVRDQDDRLSERASTGMAAFLVDPQRP